jgi:hypothetical protein
MLNRRAFLKLLALAGMTPLLPVDKLQQMLPVEQVAETETFEMGIYLIDFATLVNPVLPEANLLPVVPLPHDPPIFQSKEIILLDTYIAGFFAYDGEELDDSGMLHEDDELVLLREPENPYDGNAISIHTTSEHKLGYIPQKLNTVLARIMDQEVPLQARIQKVNPHDPDFDRIIVRVTLPLPQ